MLISSGFCGKLFAGEKITAGAAEDNQLWKDQKMLIFSLYFSFFFLFSLCFILWTLCDVSISSIFPLQGNHHIFVLLFHCHLITWGYILMCSDIVVKLTLTLMGNVQLKSATLSVVTALGCKTDWCVQTSYFHLTTENSTKL